MRESLGMNVVQVDTLIVGAGQAGVAMSAHLQARGIDHVVLEKARIAEAWRTSRWDSLVANGPAWHDRFPDKEFDDTDGDAFATKHACARYFEDYARERSLPIRTEEEVLSAAPDSGGFRYLIETSKGRYRANNIVVATGAFQVPLIPPVVTESAPVTQLHSKFYRNPEQLAPGAVLVVGAGSSGAQIADELNRAGREVYLSVGPHERPPRRYRGEDYCHWLGVLGKWEMKTPPAGREHVTISVSGAFGGYTVDFREYAAQGMNLVGMLEGCDGATLTFADDLADNIRAGDKNYLGLLDEVDDFISERGIDAPEDEAARHIKADPLCMTEPTLSLDLAERGISTIIWATGYRQDFSWLKVDTLDAQGRPQHQSGIAHAPGVYFLGLPWLTMRGSSFIWGVYQDAKHLAAYIEKSAAAAA